MQPHALSWFRVDLEHGRRAIYAGGWWVGVHCPILWDVVVDDEGGAEDLIVVVHQ